jgi:2-methylisocitrate lyase-like PEP mutase family enzyme
MAGSQAEKAQRFRALHGSCFVIGNAWDAGSARILAGVGFVALATSSGAAAGALGRRDGMITRDESLIHARAIVEAVDLPVSADLENGFGDTPDAAALTIRRAGEIGLVGGSIEDATGNPQKPLYDAGLARERMEAAVEAARAMPFPFTLTARAENFIRGNPDLDDTIKRLQAFEAAGVKRVSLATSLYRAAMTGLLNAAREVKDKGTLDYVDTTMATPELNGFMR